MPSTCPHSSAKRAEHVARAIEDRIVELGWPVGQLIGSEQSLMAEHDASRGVLREAVRLLEHHGTARMRRGPGGGLVVETPSAHAVRRSASLLLQYQQTDLASLVDARSALELACFDMMLARLEDPLVTGHLLAAIQREDARGGRADSDFHRVLVRQSGNPALALFASTLIDMHGDRLDLQAQADPEAYLLHTGAQHDEHARLVDALIAGDRQGARAHLASHLRHLSEAQVSADTPARRDLRA